MESYIEYKGEPTEQWVQGMVCLSSAARGVEPVTLEFHYVDVVKHTKARVYILHPSRTGSYCYSRDSGHIVYAPTLAEAKAMLTSYLQQRETVVQNEIASYQQALATIQAGIVELAKPDDQTKVTE